MSNKYHLVGFYLKNMRRICANWSQRWKLCFKDNWLQSLDTCPSYKLTWELLLGKYLNGWEEEIRSRWFESVSSSECIANNAITPFLYIWCTGFTWMILRTLTRFLSVTKLTLLYSLESKVLCTISLIVQCIALWIWLIFHVKSSKIWKEKSNIDLHASFKIIHWHSMHNQLRTRFVCLYNHWSDYYRSYSGLFTTCWWGFN